MRRCYAHVPAAESPLRPKAPKSPWSRRIPFPAPSGHFRIVLFLIGLIGCLCLFSPGLSFRLSVLFRSLSGFRFLWFRSSGFVGGLCVPSVFSYPLRSDGSLIASVFRSSLFLSCSVFRWGLLRSAVFVFRPYWRAYAFRFPGLRVHFFGCLRFPSSVFPLGGSCRSSVPRFPLLIRSYPFHGFVFPPPFLFLIRFPFSGFPFVFVFLFPSFSLARLACSFPFRGFRLRSGRFVFVLRFRLSASPRRNAPSGGGVGPIGQGCPRARGRPPRGWRGDAGPGSRTRAAMGGRGRRRRGGRRPMGSAGRRTRRSR